MSASPLPQTGAAAPIPAPIDGRHASRARNRLAVVDALLDLYMEGNQRPGAQEVAERSGVSRRSVFRYFDDLEDLDRTAIARHQARVAPLLELPGTGEGSLQERAETIAAQRVRLHVAIAPVARVSRRRALMHPVIAAELAEGRRYFERQVERQFAPELGKLPPSARLEALAAADGMCSFEFFDHLTAGRGRTPEEAHGAIARALVGLFGHPSANSA